ncbi:MAG: hypothetical protein AMXMBFR34_48010 [Myxococcaceae bacterium]
MHRLLALLWLLAIALGCEERPPAPVVAPPQPAPAPAPVAAAEEAPAEEEPPQPATVLEVPEEPRAEATDGESLIPHLLDDPVRAEELLLRQAAPTAWQVALLAQLAVQRGGAKTDVLPEGALPQLVPGAGAVEAGADAWVAAAQVPLKVSGAKQGGAPLTLSFNTRVKVEAVGGAKATVAVEVAREVDFGPEGSEPTRVSTRTIHGTVEASWLAPRPASIQLLEHAAATQPDTEEGRANAVALWHRSLLLARDERAREGLLRAAWAAQRASSVISAALTRNFAPARRARLAWGCKGDVAGATWMVEARATKTLPAAVCLTGVDAREACDFEPTDRRRARQEAAGRRARAGVKEGPLLELTVDARRPRALLLAGSKLRYQDSCADFEELALDSQAATLRRLKLPLGQADTVVRVAVPQYHGMEYAVLDAPSERRAAAWMRNRARYRWTMGARGQLQLSLQPGDHEFELPPDAAAVTVAAPPQKDCLCNDDQ